MKIIHSYSSLKAFEQCPWRYYLTRVSKQVKEPESEVLRWGNIVHKAFEERLRNRTPLPKILANFESIIDKIEQKTGELLVEEPIALTRDFVPTDWWSEEAYVRGKLDAAVIGNTAAVVLDWKTGKPKPDDEQLQLFAALVFAKYPNVEKLTAGYVWLQAKKLEWYSFVRVQCTTIWQNFLPRFVRMEQAFEENKWPPRQSAICKNWCYVGRKLCKFCGKD